MINRMLGMSPFGSAAAWVAASSIMCIGFVPTILRLRGRSLWPRARRGVGWWARVRVPTVGRQGPHSPYGVPFELAALFIGRDLEVARIAHSTLLWAIRATQFATFATVGSVRF